MAQFQSKMLTEMIALADYQSNNQLHEFVSLSLSSFFLPIYKLKPSQYIVTVDLDNMLSILSISDERLWFIMDGEIPKGLIVANHAKPIRMGGENRSKDLYQLYQLIQHENVQMKDIAYIEFEGQGLLKVFHLEGEDMYLSRGASHVLGLPANQKLTMYEVVKQMKKRIEMFSEV